MSDTFACACRVDLCCIRGIPHTVRASTTTRTIGIDSELWWPSRKPSVALSWCPAPTTPTLSSSDTCRSTRLNNFAADCRTVIGCNILGSSGAALHLDFLFQVALFLRLLVSLHAAEVSVDLELTCRPFADCASCVRMPSKIMHTFKVITHAHAHAKRAKPLDADGMHVEACMLRSMDHLFFKGPPTRKSRKLSVRSVFVRLTRPTPRGARTR